MNVSMLLFAALSLNPQVANKALWKPNVSIRALLSGVSARNVVRLEVSGENLGAKKSLWIPRRIESPLLVQQALAAFTMSRRRSFVVAEPGDVRESTDTITLVVRTKGRDNTVVFRLNKAEVRVMYGPEVEALFRKLAARA